jgi:lipopolysaccharide biosynthesis regulator YciM
MSRQEIESTAVAAWDQLGPASRPTFEEIVEHTERLVAAYRQLVRHAPGEVWTCAILDAITYREAELVRARKVTDTERIKQADRDAWAQGGEPL